MARGSMGGRERIMTNAVGSLSHLPSSNLQEDLNNELNAVSKTTKRALLFLATHFLPFPPVV